MERGAFLGSVSSLQHDPEGSEAAAVHQAPGDYPGGRQGDVRSEAFSFQIATDNQVAVTEATPPAKSDLITDARPTGCQSEGPRKDRRKIE